MVSGVKGIGGVCGHGGHDGWWRGVRGRGWRAVVGLEGWYRWLFSLANAPLDARLYTAGDKVSVVLRHGGRFKDLSTQDKHVTRGNDGVCSGWSC